MKPWRLPSAHSRVPIDEQAERDDQRRRGRHQPVGDDAVGERVARGAEDRERRHVRAEQRQQEHRRAERAAGEEVVLGVRPSAPTRDTRRCRCASTDRRDRRRRRPRESFVPATLGSRCAGQCVRTSSHSSAEVATRVGRVIEEADRQEAEDERPRLAPEPEILVQHVEQHRQRGGPPSCAAIYYADHATAILHPIDARARGVDAGRSRAHALDAWVREVVDWHFDPATGCPFWLDYATKARLGSAPRDHALRRPRALRPVRGRVAARRSGAALDSRKGSPASRSSCSRPAARPACRRRASPATTSAPTTSSSARRCRTSTFRKASNWLMLGPSGPRRLRLSVEHLAQYPRRHLLLRRPRSALGDQADQEGLERAPAGLQGSRDRSGGHDPAGRPRHPLHVHDAEAARSAGAPARVDGHDDPQGRHHRHLLGRHRVHAAVEPLRARGAARRRLHDADLRQHADGPRGQRAERTAQQLQDRLLRAAAARGRSRSWTSTIPTGSSTTARPAA